MNRISWSEAITAIIGPALIVGPLVGAIGGLGLGVYIIGSEVLADRRDLSFALFTGAFSFMAFGAVIGAFIAWPACLIFGSIMFRLSVRHALYRHYLAWAACGLIAGISTSAFVGLISSDMGWIYGTAWLSVPLGGLGAVICRKLVDEKITEKSSR